MATDNVPRDYAMSIRQSIYKLEDEVHVALKSNTVTLLPSIIETIYTNINELHNYLENELKSASVNTRYSNKNQPSLESYRNQLISINKAASKLSDSINVLSNLFRNIKITTADLVTKMNSMIPDIIKMADTLVTATNNLVTIKPQRMTETPVFVNYYVQRPTPNVTKGGRRSHHRRTRRNCKKTRRVTKHRRSRRGSRRV